MSEDQTRRMGFDEAKAEAGYVKEFAAILRESMIKHYKQQGKHDAASQLNRMPEVRFLEGASDQADEMKKNDPEGYSLQMDIYNQLNRLAGEVGEEKASGLVLDLNQEKKHLASQGAPTHDDIVLTAKAISTLERRPSNKGVSPTAWGTLTALNIAGERLVKHEIRVMNTPE